MADFIPFADCALAVIHYLGDSIPSILTMGFRFLGGGAPTSSDLDSLNTVIAVEFVEPLAALQSEDWQYQSIHTVDLDAVDGPVSDIPLTNTGGLSTAKLPSQVSMTVTYLTGYRGRSFRGRNYLNGFVEAALENSIAWAAPIMASVIAIQDPFFTALGSADWQQVVLSRQFEKAARVEGVATAVTGWRANAPIHTQKRRLT